MTNVEYVEKIAKQYSKKAWQCGSRPYGKPTEYSVIDFMAGYRYGVADIEALKTTVNTLRLAIEELVKCYDLSEIVNKNKNNPA